MHKKDKYQNFVIIAL